VLGLERAYGLQNRPRWRGKLGLGVPTWAAAAKPTQSESERRRQEGARLQAAAGRWSSNPVLMD